MSVSLDLFLRTVMLWIVEAILLAEAAKTGDVKLASIQIILTIFGFISFGLDGFAHAAEALVGDRKGQGAFWEMKVVIWRSTLLAFCSAVVIATALYFCQSPILNAYDKSARLDRNNRIFVALCHHSAISVFSCFSDGRGVCWRDTQ